MSAAPCERLAWDSEFFGRAIGRVTRNRLAPDEMASALEWRRCEKIEVMYLLADAAHTPTHRLAEQAGFRLTDVRIELVRDIRNELLAPPAAPVRPAVTEDIPVLRGIASGAFTDTRFYQDERFPRAACDRLYETWIENSVRGFADYVAVGLSADGAPGGFITCHRSKEEARIGLVAVSETARGKGLGRALVLHACAWGVQTGCCTIRVPTQARNLPALRLYERCGFLASACALWYHGWFDPDEA